MPRGIPNNKKPAALPEDQKAIIEKAVKETLGTTQRWAPAPDMGAIQPPTPKEKVCKHCGHLGAVHYGGENDWCNTHHCNCQGMK